MEAFAGKRDNGRNRRLRGRSERSVGTSEGKLLIKAVVADFETSQGRSTARDGLKEKLSGLKPVEITTKCIETLGQAGALVDAKAPDDAAAFKGWLRQISQHVAEASKEGGLFGGGGAPVSDKERATLQEISGALKLAA